MNLFRDKTKPVSETRAEEAVGQAFIFETKFTSDIAKAEKTTVAVKDGSKQISEETSKWLGAKDLVPRPHDPNVFLELYEVSGPFAATVDQVAVDVAGLGWKLILKEGATENKKEKEKIEHFLKKPNLKESLRNILTTMVTDWGIMGWGAIEVVRKDGGEIGEIYSVRGSTIWIHKSRKKYCQKVGTNEVWFKRYGEEGDISAKTGKEGTYSKEEKANELIMFEGKYGKNIFYPIPNILPETISAICLREIRSFNLSFFANYSIPAMAVVLTGRWKEGTAKIVTQFLDEKIKGSENSNKTIVLEVPGEGTATFHPLTEVKGGKEASFRGYEQQLEDSILMVYSMPQYRIGKSVQGRLGGTNIREATEIYKSSVVEPLQEKLENIINFMVIEDGLKCKSYQFKCNNIDTRDLASDVEIGNTLIDHGVKTPNQVRQEIFGLDGYTGGDKYYMSTSFIEVGDAAVTKEDEEDMKLIGKVGKLHDEIVKLKKEEDDINFE